jgi:hypothetical protein
MYRRSFPYKNVTTPLYLSILHYWLSTGRSHWCGKGLSLSLYVAFVQDRLVFVIAMSLNKGVYFSAQYFTLLNFNLPADNRNCLWHTCKVIIFNMTKIPQLPYKGSVSFHTLNDNSAGRNSSACLRRSNSIPRSWMALKKDIIFQIYHFKKSNFDDTCVWLDETILLLTFPLNINTIHRLRHAAHVECMYRTMVRFL